MPRKVAFSGKKKRAQLLEKRAIQRGDIPPPAAAETNAKRSTRKHRASRKPAMDSDAALAAANRTRMLVSSFLKPPAEFLEASKKAAATQPLVRPIPESSRILSPSICEPLDQGLTCPRRPKWKYEMSKKEVEKNEEGLFAKWIAQTDETIDAWRQANLVTFQGPDESILPAPTYYERNLEVWRQLWRVCEISSILMLLLDARCPPLHYPPSLDAYIKSLRPARQIILVLTKVDVVSEECASAWRTWLKDRYNETRVQVVGVQSYKHVSYGVGQGSRVKLQPHIPTNLFDELRTALKTAHEALVEPPAEIKEDPEKLAKWRPAVRAHVDWDLVGRSNMGEPMVSTSEKHEVENQDLGNNVEYAIKDEGTDEDAPSKEYLENKFLTIGLIGQPNVGKSSLLNALFGEHKAKTSRTPGKTKHFQTLFLTPEIRLVDCPGLVLPALVPMELQVLSNILPIAQIPALPACIRYTGNLMPIEDVFGVDKSLLEVEVVEDKRTWREGMRPTKPVLSPEREKWTALQVMSAYATKRGWQTARTGWPDSMRAGNAMMRSIVEGRVPWAFWPPGSELPASATGIWFQGEFAHLDEDDLPSGDETDEQLSERDATSEREPPAETEDDEEVEGEPAPKSTIGRFAALGIADESEGEDRE
ncbi:hypothetical protein CTheo_8492 [Ceratobasidium theobromae]|uniref:Guanine nucleotide-binding protein-like 1 n=1 Tax=Ceratobasidium theobromae TaxID=1582974 RepID=A0A5N5Q8L3_9AGAM|nr:hypothetical protein CTheo_8492 [Ceratobasidium theobromae]